MPPGTPCQNPEHIDRYIDGRCGECARISRRKADAKRRGHGSGFMAMKKCIGCKEIKHYTEFPNVESKRKAPVGSHPSQLYQRGKSKYCNVCFHKPAPTEKECERCGEVKPADDFHKIPRNKTGLDAYCIECRREYNREYSAKQKLGLLKPSKQKHHAENALKTDEQILIQNLRLKEINRNTDRRCAMPGCDTKLRYNNSDVICGPCDRKLTQEELRKEGEEVERKRKAHHQKILDSRIRMAEEDLPPRGERGRFIKESA